MKQTEKTISKQTLYNGHILELEKQRVVTSNGHETSREIVRHAAAVALLMITDDQQMILVEQWRTPVNKMTLEIPAGKVDARDHDDLEHAARREMNEETRLAADHLSRVNASFTSPGFTDEQITLYLATGLSPVTTKLPQDLDEDLHLVKVTLSEALQMVRQGKIDDMKTVMAIYYWASMGEHI
nr:NUDIX hydrolase [Limosilactobacillus caecicola]